MQRVLLSMMTVIFALSLTTVSWAQAQKPGEVIHWWVSGGESAALQVIIDEFENRGHAWLDTPVEASYQAKTASISRMLDGRPPMAVQWHVGKRIEDLHKEGLLKDIQPLAKAQNWQQVLPPVIWDYINIDKHVVVAPLTLHGSNWLWANSKVLADCNVSMPATWEEFKQSAILIQKRGYVPLALGGQPWQVELLFHNIALAVGGPEFYQQAFVHNDKATLSGKTMVEAFRTIGSLRPYVDDKSPGRKWNDTAQLLINGQAAFFVMGDWAKGEFRLAGMDIEKEIECALCPGTENQYIVVSDAFAMVSANDPYVQVMQTDLAGIIMDSEVQRRFNIVKGAIPPRTDAPPTGFDKCARKAMKTVKTGRVLAGLNMANTEIVASAFLDIVSKFWNTPDADPVQAAQDLANAVSEASSF